MKIIQTRGTSSDVTVGGSVLFRARSSPRERHEDRNAIAVHEEQSPPIRLLGSLAEAVHSGGLRAIDLHDDVARTQAETGRAAAGVDFAHEDAPDARRDPQPAACGAVQLSNANSLEQTGP